MHLQFYAPEHLETVADLLLDMSIHYNDAAASGRDDIRRNLVENILGEHSGVRLVLALDDRRAVGLAAISILYPAPKERGQLFMKELYVATGCRGQGIGKALMRFVARYAVSRSCSRFDWTVISDALKFYRQLGAQPESGKVCFRLSGSDLERFATEMPMPHTARVEDAALISTKVEGL